MSKTEIHSPTSRGTLRIGDRTIATDDVFRIVIDHFPDIVHSVDAEGKIVFTNRQAEKLLGYTRDELVGMPVKNIYADDIVAAMEKGFKALQQKGEKTVESALKDRYGNRIPVEIRSFAIYDDAGSFLRTFSILRDIRAVKELQDGLVHAERLAAIGELSAGIVHDINNPLTVIAGYTAMIRDELAGHKSGEPCDLAALDTMMADVQRATQSLEKLVGHLREFSRQVKEDPRPFDIAKCVGEALFLLQNKLRKVGVTVSNNVQERTHYALGEPNHLEQVFANIISNACDAMEGREQRCITVRMKTIERDGDPFWQCDVADTGCGIPEPVLKQMFTPFFTTKPNGKGTGLGLSISRAIIRDHNGDIMVQSEQGRGTVFSIILPAIPPPPPG